MRNSFVVFALFLIAGCGAETAPGSQDAGEAATWSLEPLREIGSIDDPTQALTSVGEVTLSPDGRILVAQPQDAEYRLYTVEGELERRIGGRGEGPGEFRNVGSVTLVEDGFWAWDRGNTRLTRFTWQGEVVEDERLQTANQTRPGLGGYMFGIGTLRRAEEGRALSIPGIAMSAADQQPEYPVRWLHPGGELGDTVALIGSPFHRSALEGWYEAVRVGTRVALLRDASGVAWADRDPEETEELGFGVGRVDASGDTLFYRRYPYTPIRTNVDSIRRSVKAGFSDRSRERYGDNIHVPESLPAVSEFTAASDGHLWLAREEDQDPTTWWVLDATTGDLLASLALPEGERVRDARGDLLVTSRTDEFDVPYLRLYRIVR